ncbi:MAG: hypothetical protein QM767_17675 [Anaeromyxobacter sp.]
MSRARAAAVELARMLRTLVLVVAAAALGLAALGAVPAWLASDLEAHKVPGLPEAERQLAARIDIPAYFPERLRWPPAEVWVAGGRRGTALLVFDDAGGRPAVQLLQALRAGDELYPELVGRPEVLGTRDVTLGGLRARLSELRLYGAPWRELAWELDGRPYRLRSCGPQEELERMAESLSGRTR